ncbi:MAG: hypothetical protein U9N73_06070, partial [Candidatus Auribacterota bacterium]|nr:hypothetical protein [Candidatus Auribacterota bacterium]
MENGDWGMGIGEWGMGIGEWGIPREKRPPGVYLRGAKVQRLNQLSLPKTPPVGSSHRSGSSKAKSAFSPQNAPGG